MRVGRLSCPTCLHHSAWHNVASGCLMVQLASPFWLYVSMLELLTWVGRELSPPALGLAGSCVALSQAGGGGGGRSYIQLPPCLFQ